MRFWMLLIALVAMVPALAFAGDDEGSDDGGDDAAPATTAGDEQAPTGEEASPGVETAADAPAAPGRRHGQFAPEQPDPGAITGGNPLAGLPAPPLTVELPGDFTLTILGQVQVRATLFDMDDEDANDPVVYGDPDLREGFSIRRARLGLGGSWRDLLRFRLAGGWDNRFDATDASPPDGLLLQDAWFGVTPVGAFGFRLGQSRPAFGRQVLVPSSSLMLPERSMASTLMSPDRELGLFLSGGVGPREPHALLPEDAFRWALSISNGEGDFQGDRDPRPRLAARARLDLFESWQDEESGYDLPGFAVSVGGSAFYNWGLEANSFAVAGDLGLRLWRLALEAELIYGKAVPTFDVEGIPELLAECQALGWSIQLSVVVLPGWLELAGRVDGYDDNRALDDAGDRMDVWGGVTLPLLDGRLKTQLFYVHRREFGAYETPNDSLMLQVQALL